MRPSRLGTGAIPGILAGGLGAPASLEHFPEPRRLIAAAGICDLGERRREQIVQRRVGARDRLARGGAERRLGEHAFKCRVVHGSDCRLGRLAENGRVTSSNAPRSKPRSSSTRQAAPAERLRRTTPGCALSTQSTDSAHPDLRRRGPAWTTVTTAVRNANRCVSTLPVQPERRTRQRAHGSTRQPIAEPRLARCRTPRISTPGINSSVRTVLPGLAIAQTARLS